MTSDEIGGHFLPNYLQLTKTTPRKSLFCCDEHDGGYDERDEAAMKMMMAVTECDAAMLAAMSTVISLGCLYYKIR